MTNGYYVVKSNDIFIASAKNAITTNGYLMMNKYLANATQEWAGAMAVGVFNSKSTASATDTNLEYEVARTPISMKSYTTVSGSNQIVLKGIFDQTLTGSFTEVGIFPALSVTKDNYVITDFSDSLSGSSTWTASGSQFQIAFTSASLPLYFSTPSTTFTLVSLSGLELLKMLSSISFVNLKLPLIIFFLIASLTSILASIFPRLKA